LPAAHRRKPLPHFYLFSLSAVELRRLCGISRRKASQLAPRAADLGIQRQHDRERSDEIAQFVEFGYPWSTLSERKRKSDEFDDLRKPGWLPTAIVVNILRTTDERAKETLPQGDAVTITDEPNCYITLP
jgi:hypothetical protein